MTTHVLQFVELSDQERRTAKPLGKLGKGDQVEVLVRRKSGEDQVVSLPAKAANLLEAVLDVIAHLGSGPRRVILQRLAHWAARYLTRRADHVRVQQHRNRLTR